MKNVSLIGMAVLLIVGAYVLKTKSDRVMALEGKVASQDASLSELHSKLESLDSKLKSDESALAAANASAGASRAKLEADLASAQQALAAETTRIQGLRAQELTYATERREGSSQSLSGAIQNDKTRLAELDRELKALESSSKSQNSAYKADEKAYRLDVQARIKALNAQIKGAKDEIKSLDQQIKSLQKKKNVFDKPAQLEQLQNQRGGALASLSKLESDLAELKAKEASDLGSNAYEEQQKHNYTADQRAELSQERNRVAADLANLKSRTDLSKRDDSDVAARIKAIQAQEHESDLKIQALNQTIARLKSELAK